MEPFYVGVSSPEQAEAVYAQNAVPVFALQDQAFSGLDEVTLQEIDTARPYGVLMNRLYREADLAGLKDLLKKLNEQMPERIYFSDPAVLSLCEGELRRHLVFRPETLLTNAQDIHFWMTAGIGSASVSPLLTAEELYAIAESEPHAEFVIHGHLLMSVSARKLLSSWAEQYHIRVPEKERLFLREETRNDFYPLKETAHGTMIFTDYVLESFDYIRGLKEHGASSFYIDGSFLKTEDLSDTLRLYRSVLEHREQPEEITAWRARHPECTEGYYGQETVL